MQQGFTNPRPGKVFHHESSYQRSPRDADSTGKLWMRSGKTSSQDFANTNQISRLTQVVNKLKRRVIGMPPSTTPMAYPFKLYQANNPVNAASSWLTFQVRGGFFGWRSIYTLPVDIVSPPGLAPGSMTFGNNENALYCDGTDNLQGANLDGALTPYDGGNGSLQQFTLPNVGDTNITLTQQFLGAVPFNVRQIILDSHFDNGPFGGSIQASFWLDILDFPPPYNQPNNPTGTNNYPALFARMFSTAGGQGRAATPFPAVNPSIIPLATVTINQTNQSGGAGLQQYLITQYLTGNQLGRYVLNDMNYRGAWSGNGLSGQVFYPGDIVFDDSAILTKSVSPSGSFTYYETWRYANNSPVAIINTPPSTGTGWVKISSSMI